jgi:FkbM family methyltransferase
MNNKYILYIFILIFGFLFSVIFQKQCINQENFHNKNFDNNTIDLQAIHSKIKLIHGSLMEEYPEQLLSVKYIKPTDIVLEIGGNFGRNSCTIATILNDSSNMLVIESDSDNSNLLRENRDHNKLNFHIEDCAISKVDLYQKGWTTKPIEEIEISDIENWKQINTKSWKEIKNKYNVEFNTLVADCEGALYYIMKENPDFLQTFNKIIIENDFNDIKHKQFVDNEFKKYNLERVYHEQGGWGPCYDFFYEVWIKN